MKRRLATLALLASVGCAAFAGKSDYADYRAVRMASGDEEKLLAMQHYVSTHPRGQWVAEVQAERRARDMEVFDSGKSHRAGLELYLKAFPDGAFAEQARSRLGAIAMIEERKSQEAAQAAALLEERKKREAELRRTWVSRFARFWIETLLSVEQWGSPIEAVARGNPEFSRAFGRPPRPRCTREECVKYYDSRYGVPVPGGTRVERQMRLLLRLRLDAGKLERAELLLPSWGFSRWFEVEERKVVVDADPTERQAAVDWALARLQPLLAGEGRALTPIEGFSLAPIGAPAISASGELADTTAADPSAPANRIQGSAGAPEPEPSVGDLVAPVEPEAAPDMVMAPLQVDEQGTPIARTAPEAAPAEAAAAGEEMVMAPLAVNHDGGVAAVPAPDGGVALEAVHSPRQVRAFTIGDLRLVLVAAGTDEAAPAYDGIVIERVPPPPPAGAKRPGKRP